MERIICVMIGYLFGLFQTGYIYGKVKGIDIREYGSGNAGTTNMLRTLGLGPGAITFLGDGFKCIFAVMLTRAVFRESCSDILPLIAIYTAAGVVLGHNFPFYLKFRGGKGIAATGGFIASISIPLAAAAIALFALVLVLTHYVSLGSLVVCSAFLIELIVCGQMGVFGMTQRYLNEMYLVAAFLTVLAFWMHRGNIARLCKGEERKTYIFKKK